MSPRVSVVGLGNIGAAIARTLLYHGYQVTLWNRTESKAQSLVAAGAVLAQSTAQAIAASPLSIFSLTDKQAAQSILEGPGVAPVLQGATIVELSTGSAAEAGTVSNYVGAAGGHYLDGANLQYPRDIGKDDGVILYSGSAEAFREHKSTLAILAGDSRYLGTNPTASAILYLALNAQYFGALTAYLEGAALSRTVGVQIRDFQSLAAIMSRKLDVNLVDVSQRIETLDYSGTEAPVDAHVDIFDRIRQAMQANGIRHQCVDAFSRYLDSTRNAGDGDKDIAVLLRTIGGRD